MPGRYLAAALITASTLGAAALGFAATATADQVCPQNFVRVQGDLVETAEGPVCDTDRVGGDGLLGGAPVVGDLPGLGGIL